MSRLVKVAFVLLVLFGIVAVGSLFVFSGDMAVLAPKGIIGEKQRDLIVTSTVLMLIVVVPVFLMTFFICWKYRAEKKSKYTPDWAHSTLAEVVWWGVPCIIIVALGVITWKSCHELDPFKPIESDKKAVEIQAVALQWKWLFIYPEHNIAAVSYVQFPDQTPLNFEITADAPMNSFWIPALGGQVYAMPGMRAKLHLMANEPGSYRGSSANLSGEGFSGMIFEAKSTSEADFAAWVASVKASGEVLTMDVYTKLVEPSSYVPAKVYVLEEKDLFEKILAKYMAGMTHD